VLVWTERSWLKGKSGAGLRGVEVRGRAKPGVKDQHVGVPGGSQHSLALKGSEMGDVGKEKGGVGQRQ